MSSQQRPNYARVPLDKRQKLVQMVCQQRMSIAKAGRALLLKPSTAKLIVKRYRETGSFFIRPYNGDQLPIPSPNQAISAAPILIHHGISAGTVSQDFSNEMAHQNQTWSSSKAYQHGFYLIFPMENSNFIPYY